jgi:hypothetical protein
MGRDGCWEGEMLRAGGHLGAVEGVRDPFAELRAPLRGERRGEQLAAPAAGAGAVAAVLAGGGGGGGFA